MKNLENKRERYINRATKKADIALNEKAIPVMLTYVIPDGVHVTPLPSLGWTVDHSAHKGLCHMYLGSDNRLYSYLNKVPRAIEPEFVTDTHVGFKLNEITLTIPKLTK